LGLFPEILLALAKLLRGMLSIIIGCLELLMATPHIMLGCLCMLHVGATSHVHLNHFFDLRVVKGLAHLINLDLNKFGRIVILILGSHPLSLFELSDMNPEVTHPINVFFDLLGIIKTFLEDSFFFDLFKDPQFRHNFGVHTAIFKICRLSNL
jgi:hypothetical protein